MPAVFAGADVAAAVQKAAKGVWRVGGETVEKARERSVRRLWKIGADARGKSRYVRRVSPEGPA
jgi:hypothetical protein